MAVDVEADLAGGGTARISVQLERDVEDRWHVRWFGGPGAEWPPPPRRRGTGLTSSSADRLESSP